MTTQAPLLAPPSKGHIFQLMVVTFPLLIVLLYFLFEAWQRPRKSIYNLPENYSENEWQQAQEEAGELFSLMDIMTVFLCLCVCWTIFAVYVASFVPKRRHLIGRYLTEGETSLGDVIYDRSSRACGGFQDYAHAVYAHPTQEKVIRKRVRVFQPYTRERVTILRLPNRPLSGQPKVDLEIDLNASSKERDSRGKYIGMLAFAWVAFTLLGATFVVYQMHQYNDEDEDPVSATKLYLLLVGLNPLLAYALNWIRFLLFRNWMINRGAVVNNDPDARKIQDCLNQAQSEDGSDIIPYSLLNEEELSYQGSLASHNGKLPQDGTTVVVLGPDGSETRKPWVTIN